ncbi:hypothetical protein VPH35_100491 [Triticum aestivum]|uniref:60S ribosomal protein L7-3 n=1 Tax=Aegilops tauschii TaxID=37682 RepID=M8BTG4_AEGTA
MKGGLYVNHEAKRFVVRIHGYPNLRSARELMYKRGLWQAQQAKDSSVQQQSYRGVGPQLKEANKFIWPSKLKESLGGLKKKRNHYVEGGETHNRENCINQLIGRMN